MASPFRISLSLALGLTALGLVAASPAHPGIDPANLDTSVKPCDNFYEFANGGWLKSHTLPADKSRLGAFTEVMDHNREILKQILDETSAKRTWKPGSVEQKVGDFFAAGMDEKAIEKRGLAPMKPIFATIDGLKDSKKLPAVLAKLHNEGVPGGFGFYVGPDDKDSTHYLGALYQGGLGLPDRDYYLNNDARTKNIREKYEAHVAKMLQLAGDSADLAKVRARIVLDLETRMAKAAWSRVELRNPQKTYNKQTLANLEHAAPGFDWALYFKDRGIKLEDLNVGQPSYIAAFAKLASETPATEWRTYLRWHAIHDAAPVLPKAFGEESFAFYGKVLNGTPEQEIRWKRVEGLEDGLIGEALGQLYVKKAFPPESKQRMLQLVANLRSALHDRILGLDWMSEATKAQAIKKLDA
ncbi:MAG TPA: M13 family metallopeptidase N-terminal domain-containing protein, partial [Holophagaceae bacterium]